VNLTYQATSDHIKTHRQIYLLVGLIAVLNLGILWDLVADWIRDDNYSHGFLVIPIAAWLFWRKRDTLVFPAESSKLGLLVVLAGSVGIIFGVAASEYFTTRFSLVLMVTGVSLYYLGLENFRKVWFSFVFLLFMIPIPAIIYFSATLPMQLMASKVTVVLLETVGVPVSRSGNIIYLPDFVLEVAEACSGLRSLVTLLALGAIYGNLYLPGRVLPIILFVATVPIAIVTNVFRIFVTAIGAYAISKELAEDFLHEISGMIVFVSALILMLILGSIMKWIRKLSLSSSS